MQETSLISVEVKIPSGAFTGAFTALASTISSSLTRVVVESIDLDCFKQRMSNETGIELSNINATLEYNSPPEYPSVISILITSMDDAESMSVSNALITLGQKPDISTLLSIPSILPPPLPTTSGLSTVLSEVPSAVPSAVPITVPSATPVCCVRRSVLFGVQGPGDNEFTHTCVPC